MLSVLLELSKVLASPVAAAIIGVFAYFYKRHIDKIEKYQTALEEARYIMEKNHTILSRPSSNKEIMYKELSFVPAFTLHEFPPFDYSIRLSIKAHNTFVASPKLGVSKGAFPIPKVKDAIQKSLLNIYESQAFINEISEENMLKYYVFQRLLKEKMAKFGSRTNGKDGSDNAQPHPQK